MVEMKRNLSRTRSNAGMRGSTSLVGGSQPCTRGRGVSSSGGQDKRVLWQEMEGHMEYYWGYHYGSA